MISAEILVWSRAVTGSGAAIVKAVLLFVLRCRLRMDVPDRERRLWPPRRPLLGLLV